MGKFKVIKEVPLNEMFLMPPAPGLCPECAVEHTPDLPHNKDSFYYQTKFYMANKRSPTWDDAMAHCTEEMKTSWKETMARVLESTQGILKEKKDDSTALTE